MCRTRGLSGPKVGLLDGTHFEEDLEYKNIGFLFSKALKFEPHVVWGKQLIIRTHLSPVEGHTF